ncbi:MAG: helix-turn-helix domain-containing protein, partial [Candidatus Hydrogenedentes bacterium]|nr:helix-turn-helix domain-containing protein [Candidatus Hydrogenedentota bacterium]
ASLANIPVAWLIALEDDRLEDLPSTADPDTLVTAYARGLGLNPAPWLDMLKAAPRRRHRRNWKNHYGVLLDDRRANFRRSLISMAVVAILWVMYTMILNFATGNRYATGIPTDTEQEARDSIRR